MNHDQISFLNPNYFHKCHPFDLRSYFESDPFFENLDSAFPLNLAKAVAPAAKLTHRQRVLKRFLENTSVHDLVGKGFVEQYLRDQYRRNCRPNTPPEAFGKVMSIVKPRMAVAYQFINNNFDTAPNIQEGIRKTYDGPLTRLKNMLVWNVISV